MLLIILYTLLIVYSFIGFTIAVELMNDFMAPAKAILIGIFWLPAALLSRLFN